MNIKHIVLDANILVKNYNFNSEDLVQLIKLKDFFGAKLYLPKVVKDECIGNYENEAKELRFSIKSHFSKYKKILVDIEKTKFDEGLLIDSLSHLSEYYKPRLEQFIINNNIDILDYPSISHEHIVERIYAGKIPFGKDKCSEKGYKDYLILCTIKELESNIPEDEYILIYTKNLNDFVNGNAQKGKNEIISIDHECETDRVRITASVSAILNYFSKNIKLKENADLISDHQKFGDLVGNTILANSIIEEEVYGLFGFEPTNIKNEIFTLKSVNVSFNDKLSFLEVTGECKIQFLCNFKMNPFLYEDMNKTFVFYEKVDAILKEKNYKEDEFWEVSFYDFSYCQEFEFNYTDFSFNKEKGLDNLDDYSLMITKLNL